MRYTYVARQPILNAKGVTLGYELLFRDGEMNAFPSHISSERATYRLIAENFLTVGCTSDRRSARCFINFPYKSLIRRLPFTLPKHRIVVEVLETCEPTDELYYVIRDLHRHGYLLALDDFVYSPAWERFLPYVHIVKLDIMALGVDEACQFVQEKIADKYQCRFLAERVETEEEFLQTKAAGFSFFQGYYFRKPQVTKKRYVVPEYLTAMNLFIEVCRPEVDFERVEEILSQDVTLSYKLLRFVNALSDRLCVSISSFRQALIYLGQDRLKSFVSLTVASYIAVDKPKELYRLSLQRAHFCQLMSSHDVFHELKGQAFMIGLFSVLDAILDVSIDDLMEQLPLPEVAKEALAKRKGVFGDLLTIQEHFERGDWHGIETESVKIGLSVEEVSQSLHDALCWSNNAQYIV
ncbi:EAL and HDOD domain-containing protein [Vibrio gazogenes]|uniref:EAL and modified HD-GYP domain-containing signal transduction protein n=1 Tax=Vibrio gazogenes DSM 21264 = NBRC 103151 TaxID=1123492 RepID=A0A1M5BUN4_VIBGA|nr:EAL domain-containing protein [Vibrio gazogenes]USP13654.1 EAL domain-containing protein [Vibrio gazogenes]SHF45987.1 EAL and modified HD-GYP domain-containing signal transduction protein [Vibrio gazogenes DSM 21264] [Vibrio gazogenes DSM 21264 = NBRC 103151]SJN55729.1 biofilm formation regulator HmsP [Vibrio gazogenes]